MSVNSRRKGKSGELELFKIIRDELGVEIKRNLNQTQNGGADADRLLCGYLIEVKNQQRLELAKWWDQAVKQAAEYPLAARPLLAYRLANRAADDRWRCVTSLHYFVYTMPLNWDYGYTVDMSLTGFLFLWRESLAKEELHRRYTELYSKRGEAA